MSEIVRRYSLRFAAPRLPRHAPRAPRDDTAQRHGVRRGVKAAYIRRAVLWHARAGYEGESQSDSQGGGAEEKAARAQVAGRQLLQ